jgi:hypothetical protein
MVFFDAKGSMNSNDVAINIFVFDRLEELGAFLV